MTAGSEDGTAGGRGRLRTSRADREQAIEVLKSAFVSGRLTKGEFDLRVGRVFASRTYAGLHALTADLPGEVTIARPPGDDVADPGRMLRFRTAVGVGAVGGGISMASAAALLLQPGGVPAAFGVIVVGLTGVLVTGLLAALLMLLSWVVRSQSGAAPGPPSGPADVRPKRQAPARPLRSATPDRWHSASSAIPA